MSNGIKRADQLFKVTKDSLSIKRLSEILTNWIENTDLNNEPEEVTKFINEILKVSKELDCITFLVFMRVCVSLYFVFIDYLWRRF